MAISNGFDDVKVLNALKGRIGWRQSTEPEYAILDAQNQQTASGRYFNDFHKSVTIPNIKSAQENKAISNSDFNNYLRGLVTAVVFEMANEVFKKPQVVDEPRYLFERRDFTQDQILDNAGKFVGFKVRVAEGNYSVQLHAIKMFFNSDVTFNLYLFDRLKKNPIKVFEVSATANDITEIDLPDWVIKDGIYYVGYYQTDIGPAKAINFSPCIEDFKMVGIAGCELPEADLNSMPYDREGLSITNNYGINIEIGSYRDYTKQIVRNAHLFDELLGLSMAVNVIDEILYTTRSNGKQRITEEQQINALINDQNLAMPTEQMPFMPGLRSRLSKELKRVYYSFFPKPGVTTTVPNPCSLPNRNQKGLTSQYNDYRKHYMPD